MSGRFELFDGKSETFLMCNGLLEQTPEEQAEEQVLLSSAGALSLLWKDSTNAPRVIAWDSEFERYLDHRIKLIKLARENYLPWNIYKEMGLNWVNGLTMNQGALGSCAGAAFRNSMGYSDLVNCKMTKSRPTEVGCDIVYALARGNGRLNWGSGCNGTPLVKYGTEVGNYWASDMGKYDTRGGNVTQANMNNPAFKARALQKQSIIAFYPEITFERFWKVGAAGLFSWIGSSSFPNRATKNSENLSQASSFTNGAHATTMGSGIELARKYIWWSNQHGNQYAGGARDRFDTPSDSTWIDNIDFPRFKINTNYGRPFVHIGEIPCL